MSSMVKPADTTKHVRRNFLFAILWIALLAIGIGSLNYGNELVPPSLYLIQYKHWGSELLNGASYTVTYPLWGYPILVAAIGRISWEYVDALVFALQVGLCLALVLLWIRQWVGEWKPIRVVLWSILLVPIFSFASFRAPDAWVMLVLMSVFLGLRHWFDSRRVASLVLVGIAVMIGVNMRSELLWFLGGFFVLAFLFALFIDRPYRPVLVGFSLVGICGVSIGIAPWACFAYHLTGTPVLTSTNGGHVFYISLGQLPNNPWGRNYDDGDGMRYALSQGLDTSTSVEGNRLLTQAALNDIKNYPVAFLQKVALNFGNALTGGVYTLYDWWGDEILKRTSKLESIQRALSGDPYGVAWAIGSAVSWVFRIIFFVLCVVTFWLTGKSIRGMGWTWTNRVLLMFCFTYLLFTFAVVSFLQYQPRHLTALYALQVLLVSQLFAGERWVNPFLRFSGNARIVK